MATLAIPTGEVGYLLHLFLCHPANGDAVHDVSSISLRICGVLFGPGTSLARTVTSEHIGEMERPDAEVDSLIRQARAGSASSLGALLDGYRNYLLRIASDRIKPALRAKLAPSDVVQGTMLVAMRDFPNFRGETEREIRAWLLSIVSTQVVDGFRRFVEAEKRRADREVAGADNTLHRVADDIDSPSTLAVRKEDAAKLLKAIEEMPAELRDVVEARYLEGLTFSQIAERLSVPVTTCRRRWLEAVELIGEAMGYEL